MNTRSIPAPKMVSELVKSDVAGSAVNTSLPLTHPAWYQQEGGLAVDATRDDLTLTLIPSEWKWCIDVANLRMFASAERGLDHASTYERSYLERISQDIAGACAELIVARFLGLYWTPSVNTFHDIPDIAPDIEVRHTVRMNGRLPVRKNDQDDRWYFLVIGEPPTMTIAGFIKGVNAKRDEWLDNPNGYRPAWFVPQDALLQPKRRDAPA